MLRRTFIKKTGLYLPALWAAPSLLAACNDDPMPGVGKKVIVVGAGLAGLHAAHLLLEKGYDVEVLEASARWGGRVRALKGFADFPIELGAEEIHGSMSDWYQVVKSTGAKFVSATKQDYYWFNAMLRIEQQVENTPDGAKAFDFVEQAVVYSGADKTVQQWANEKNIPVSVLPFTNAQLGNEYGTSNSRLSVKGIAEEDYIWTAGSDFVLLADRSFQEVISQKMAAAIDRVSFSTAVKAVDYSNAMVKVTDVQGQVREANHVVITVPLTVLRDGDIQFLPALPTEKTEAMQKIGMGAGMKIVLKFSQRFWPADLGSLYGTGPVPQYWQTSFGRGNTPILTAFVMGEKAEYLSSLGNAATAAVLADLDVMFGGGQATAQFVAAQIMDWSKEPFVRGAYSYPMVGGGLIMRRRLAAPVSGKVFFAGEATHFEGHSGTMHGAMESATRAVEELVG